MAAILAARRGTIGRAVTFDPNSVTGLYVWYKADAITGLSDGGSLTSWVKSGGTMSGNLASTGTAPLYKTGQLHGYPSVRFNGTGYMTEVVASQSLSQPYVRFMVARATSTPGSNQVMVASDGTTVNGTYLDAGSSRFGNYSGAVLLTGSAYTFTAAHVIEVVHNGGSSTIAADGTATAGDTGAAPQNGLHVGANQTGAEFYSGDIFEVLIYAGALSSGNRSLVRAYLGSKYAITVT